MTDINILNIKPRMNADKRRCNLISAFICVYLRFFNFQTTHSKLDIVPSSVKFTERTGVWTE